MLCFARDLAVNMVKRPRTNEALREVSLKRGRGFPLSLGEAKAGQWNERSRMRSLTTFEAAPAAAGAVGRWIPRPTIPVQPVLSLGTFLRSGGVAAPAITDTGNAIYVAAGRIAIALALELLGVRRDEKVLIPAYHCAAMVEPLSWVAARPAFYALRDDLSVDLRDIAAKIDGATRVLMVPNFFGFPQDLETIRKFCDERGIKLLEDCAHSFFGSHAGRPLGSFGHLAVGSLTKFFPVRDGGCLVMPESATASSAVALRAHGIGDNLTTLVDTVEDAIFHGRLLALRPLMTLAAQAKRSVHAIAPSTRAARATNPAQMRSGKEGGFDPTWMNLRMTAVSRLVCRLAARDRIVTARRRNYVKLVDAFFGLRRCRPIFPNLPDGTVPYMFPLWVDHLAEVFPILEDRAVPMQRFGQFLWSGVDDTVCPVSMRHARHLIQLPCHQDLTEAEIGAIVGKVRPLVEA